jgi:aldose 1-epimerase
MIARRSILFLLAIALSGFALHAFGGRQTPPARTAAAKPETMTHPYGKTAEGHAVTMFALTNAHGLELRAMTYGAIITSLKVPDRSGALGDIVLGFDRFEEYLNDPPYFGAIIGRYGNRIAGGQFTLDGRTYSLAKNNGPNHLHGGRKGFDKAIWQATPSAGGAAVAFSRTSPDGEEGYPGNLQVRVSYTLTDSNELIVEYHARTDKATPINLTQHTYFNLTGDVAGDILGHELTIRADRFTPVDATLIPTGQIAPVEGTPFDFRRPTAIGARIAQPHQQLANGNGYDHNWVLNRNGQGLEPAARVVEPKSGRTLDVATTEPGLQFYTGNFLDGTIKGKGGRVYARRTGFCLETQHFPDSPNKPAFPSTILRPGQEYSTKTVFTFGVIKEGRAE